jgi:hypothetical protein
LIAKWSIFQPLLSTSLKQYEHLDTMRVVLPFVSFMYATSLSLSNNIIAKSSRMQRNEAKPNHYRLFYLYLSSILSRILSVIPKIIKNMLNVMREARILVRRLKKASYFMMR